MLQNNELETTLWAAADKMRSNMDAAEYKHVVLGLIFLKYISDAFNDLYEKLKAGEGEYQGADPEDPDEYLGNNIFFVPEKARWLSLQNRAKQPQIGQYIDDAMDAIERINPPLKGVLPKIYADPELNKQRLGELIDLIGTIGFNQGGHSPTGTFRAQDLLGRVYEYFLGQFADAEGKKGGQFYTPASIVKLLVAMLEPYNGRVYDGCCGSGGMFVQSEKFVLNHQGNIKDLSIFGQESNPTTLRLARMNLAIRGIDARLELGDTFLNDKHPDLKADFILANPPFNISDWSGEQLREDARWKYGAPPVGNANYAWLQHFIHKLSPNGSAGIVLANGSMNSSTSNEGEIRKNMIEAGLVDCMVALPSQLFYNTQIPACLWFLSRARSGQSQIGQPQIGQPQIGQSQIGQSQSGQPQGLPLPPQSGQSQSPQGLTVRAGLAPAQILPASIELQSGQPQIGQPQSPQGLTVRAGLAPAQILPASIELQSGQPQSGQPQSGQPQGLPLHIPARCQRGRSNEILFIDARKLGTMINRRNKAFTDEDINLISDTYHAWRNQGGGYEDKTGFCKSATLDEVRTNNYVLMPGRYVGTEEIEDDGVLFEDKMNVLTTKLAEQFARGDELEQIIRENLKGMGYEF